MRKVLAIFCLVAVCVSARAVDRITATVTVTNAAGTTNGQTITVNSSVRTWTNNVVLAGSQILTNSTAAGSKTNLFDHVALAPFSQVTELDRSSTALDLVGNSGVAMAVTLSAGWGTVTYSTQVVTSLIGVRVPMAGEASGGMQTNIASLVVTGVNDLSTNSFYENAIALINFLGNTNSQFVLGLKIFTNAAGQWMGIVSNAPAISGNIFAVSNGIWKSGILLNPTLTNGVNYGNAFRSPGAGSGSEQYGLAATAVGSSSTAVGASANAQSDQSTAVGSDSQATGVSSSALGDASTASGEESVAVGKSSTASGTGAIALGVNASAANTASVALGESSSTTADFQIMLGASAHYVHVPGNLRVDGNTELTWKRFSISSLANGNNAAVAVGTNTFVEVSGPTGAFNVNGIAGGRDGKLLIILNQTSQNMTIAHDSGVDPTAGNRIYSMTGADRATTGNGSAMLIYSGAASRWILLSLDQ